MIKLDCFDSKCLEFPSKGLRKNLQGPSHVVLQLPPVLVPACAEYFLSRVNFGRPKCVIRECALP